MRIGSQCIYSYELLWIAQQLDLPPRAQTESAVTMPKWHLYVPVVCSDADTQYHGVCYMEPISRITEVNGKSSSNLTKSDFKTGDIVKVKYNSKLFTGVVDLSQDKEQLEQRHGQDAGPSSDDTKAVGNEKQQC